MAASSTSSQFWEQPFSLYVYKPHLQAQSQLIVLVIPSLCNSQMIDHAMFVLGEVKLAHIGQATLFCRHRAKRSGEQSEDAGSLWVEPLQWMEELSQGCTQGKLYCPRYQLPAAVCNACSNLVSLF